MGAVTLEGAFKLTADVNGDGRVHSGDATLILRRAVNAISSFPVEAK